MMEMESASNGAADLLMECEEEEQEVWSQSKEKDEDEEDDEGLEAAASPLEEEQEETDPPPVRFIPIPVQPVSNCSPPIVNNTVKSAGALLGFMVNGRLVSLQPGGGGAELKLRSHPGGSASGFTTVHIPVTLTVHSPVNTHHINTTAPLTVTPAPDAEPTPIITGIVSGEAAQKVLSDHSMNFKPSSSLMGQKTPPRASSITKPSPNSKGRPAARDKLLRKGELGPISPPDCLVCGAQYKLITELRGFLCLCSPTIAQSLKNLRRKNKYQRRSRDKKKISKTSRDLHTSYKVPKTRPGLSASKPISPLQRTHRLSDDFMSDHFTSPVPCTDISSPQPDLSEAPLDAPNSKLVILVEDFYYSSAPGRTSINPSIQNRKFTGPYRCIHCPKTLCNNIKLMCHMQQHVLTMSQQDGDMDSVSSCPHCFRHFMSPFKLQCHLEAVHSLYKSTATCRICELDFGSEPAFLWHMKRTHKPGEMPYVCQVCDFRSSFYSDVWSHFQEAHADTKFLLCQYCLRVLRSNTCYQQHFARHQKKHVFSCDKCRLHFLFAKERVEHMSLHRTHIRPPQLAGLKPGTKVTVRTYSVVGAAENEEGLKKPAAPCKVVDVEPPPPRQEAPKRKPVESLGPLLDYLSQESEAPGVSQPFQRCIECLSSVRDFRAHFPSLVHCSLCRFLTCCSTSYANHMINNHASCRKIPQYQTIFQTSPSLSQMLKCKFCTFSTNRGDMMANHLSERPEHSCIMLTHTGWSADGAQPAHRSDSAPSPGTTGGGAFIPIHLLPSGQASAQLSVKPLTSPSPLSSPPAMTIRFLGPRPQQYQSPASPLSVSQLSVVLSSLCHGVTKASRQHRTSPLDIRTWTEQQQHGLSDRKWCWRTEKIAHWVLSQREQQLMVSEDILLQTARKVLGEYSLQLDCYSWTVDFMLRHELGLQTNNERIRRNLPKKIRENSHAVIQSLCSQVQSKSLPPHCVGSMDEFSIFIDLNRFNNQDPSAFQLFGSSEDRPMFDVALAALSDGTLLPPLLFFRGAPSPVPEGFPKNVLLEAQQEGFSDQERLQIWIDKVWRPRVVFGQSSLLLVDIHRGHLTEAFKNSLSLVSTDLIFIPSGCSCRLQPLAACVTPVLRDFLQARWTQLVSQGGLDGLGPDQLALTLACWLSEVASTLNSETDILCRSFSSVCNLQQVEDCQEATRRVTALTQALIQPVETPAPGPEQLEVLLVMEQGRQAKVEQVGQEEVNSPTALRLVFEGDSDPESFHGFQDTEKDGFC
uniref:C2H2-type domain-containing protein n=1 Tax=Mastacembelus armatus TaxID=205130 RepID=A0A3Q3NB40_9TELE